MKSWASLLAALIGIVKKIPDTAVSESLANAEAAAASAEAAAESAESVSTASTAETTAYLGIA